ncbi:aminotransferase class V-fold PLP-dependent enzyme [soil metagenome]
MSVSVNGQGIFKISAFCAIACFDFGQAMFVLSRRELMAVGAAASFRNDTLDLVEKWVGKLSFDPVGDAQNEEFWTRIQQAFALDRNVINFNNGGCSPSPRVVQDALRRQLEFANQAPSYFMWRQLEPEVENVRMRLARTFGVDTEEIAITRNASESLENCLFGFDFEPGDEVITTKVDYPRFITTFQQRERRDGIKLIQVSPPAIGKSMDEFVKPFADAITAKTKLILVSHVSFMNGQIFPVSRICDLGRERGIPVVVDGAHAFAQFPFKQKDLKCDFYGVSLHKWLMAPIGTGFLYVKKERIGEVWSLMASTKEQTNNIRKFEEIGTHPAANHNAIGEALTFHEMLGVERKEARFRYLRSRWVDRIKDHPRVRFQTNLDPRHSCALTTVGIEGIKESELAGWLLTKHAIVVTSISGEIVNGIRVTPNVYSTVDEIDRLGDALVYALDKGIA